MSANKNILTHFFRQPNRLPEDIRQQLAERYPEEAVRLYAYCDLDASRNFSGAWLLLSDVAVYMATTSQNGSHAWVLQRFALKSLKRASLREGFTLNRLDLISDTEELVCSAFFTRRQLRTVGNLQLLLESMLKGEPTEASEADAIYEESVAEALSDARSTTFHESRSVLLRLLSYLKPHRKLMWIGALASVVLTILQLLPPYLTRVLIDDVINPAATGQIAEPSFWLWLIVGSLAGVWLVSELMNFLRLRIMSFTGERIATRLREELYEHLQALSLSFYNRRSTGSLISRMTSDTDRLWDFITFGIIEFIIAVLTLFGVSIALFLQDAELAALVVIPMPLMIYLFYRHSKTIRGLFLRIWRKWSAMTAILSDVIPGVRVVRAFAQEGHEIQRFGRRNNAVLQEAFRLHRNWTAFWPRMVLLMHLCSLIVWAVGAPRVLTYVQTGGAEGMPLGVFIAFTGYMWMFWGPLQQIGGMTRTFNRATTSAARVFEILDTRPSIVTKPDAVKLDPFKGGVRFRNVYFSYDGIRSVLKDISFDVNAGEMIGLVGPSGGGKSTLVNLICRFYDITSGEIRLDGVDLRDLDLHHLRRQIGIVLQEPYLFHGTIADNIAYGIPDAGHHDIIEAARAANAHEFICNLPDAYDSMVGERGLTLSGGERQRISIARAILNNPRLLILDEATSSVDTETEKKIQEALGRLVAGRTTIAIAHRLSTLSAASRLFVIEDGKLVESGTHKELLAKEDGAYARLHKTQLELQAMIAV